MGVLRHMHIVATVGRSGAQGQGRARRQRAGWTKFQRRACCWLVVLVAQLPADFGELATTLRHGCAQWRGVHRDIVPTSTLGFAVPVV